MSQNATFSYPGGQAWLIDRDDTLRAPCSLAGRGSTRYGDELRHWRAHREFVQARISNSAPRPRRVLSRLLVRVAKVRSRIPPRALKVIVLSECRGGGEKCEGQKKGCTHGYGRRLDWVLRGGMGRLFSR